MTERKIIVYLTYNHPHWEIGKCIHNEADLLWFSKNNFGDFDGGALQPHGIITEKEYDKLISRSD